MKTTTAATDLMGVGSFSDGGSEEDVPNSRPVRVAALDMLAESEVAAIPTDWAGHPWRQESGAARMRAVHEAAKECFGIGLSAYQASVLVLDWNKGNRPPMDAETAMRIVIGVYVALSGDEYSRRGGVGPLLGSSGSQIGARSRSGGGDDLGMGIRLSDHVGAVPAAKEWLVPGLLPAGERVGLLGQPGSGKTWLALDAAMALAYGSGFLGTSMATGHGTVVIIDGEGGSRRAIRRFNELLAVRKLDADLVRRSPTTIHWRTARGLQVSGADWWDDSGWLRLGQELAAYSPKLVIFDTLAKVLGGQDENSNAVAARVTAEIGRLGAELNATMLVLSHPAKDDQRGAWVRGAGELSADLDLLWTIRRDGSEARELRCVKDRDGDLEGAVHSFEVVRGKTGLAALRRTWGQERPTVREAIKRVVADSDGITGGEVWKRVASMTGVSRSLIYEEMATLRRRGVITRHGRVWRLP